MPATPPDVTADLAHELRLVLMRLTRRMRQQRGDHGLPLGLLSVLATLERSGPLTPGALAQLEQVRPPTMTKALATLDEGGYVDRVPDPHDGRQQLVSITTKATQLLDEDRRRRDEWFAALLIGLAPEQRDVLVAALPVLEVLADS
jgi:DNA-binding MarR family transcriptional regulator